MDSASVSPLAKELHSDVALPGRDQAEATIIAFVTTSFRDP
ncbi:MAG: hypothetical protein OXD42_07280 [Rhodospirillaceae bacterium]|nr:hypothetical protein [Rhodospirillaceae bacterium]